MVGDEDRCRFSEEELAASTFRAFTGAAVGLAVAWEKLTPEAQSRMRAFVRAALPLLEQAESVPFATITILAFEAAGEAGPKLGCDGLLESLAWEAAVRHLASLYFAEEAIDVDALERSWADWVQKKLIERGAA